MQLVHVVLSPHLSPAISCQSRCSQSHKKAVACTGEVEYSLSHNKPHTEEEVGGRDEGNHQQDNWHGNKPGGCRIRTNLWQTNTSYVALLPSPTKLSLSSSFVIFHLYMGRAWEWTILWPDSYGFAVSETRVRYKGRAVNCFWNISETCMRYPLSGIHYLTQTSCCNKNML